MQIKKAPKQERKPMTTALGAKGKTMGQSNAGLRTSTCAIPESGHQFANDQADAAKNMKCSAQGEALDRARQPGSCRRELFTISGPAIALQQQRNQAQAIQLCL
jgi:hypothetical protein